MSLVEKNNEKQLKKIKIILETKTVTSITLTRTATSINTTTETVPEPREGQKLFTDPVTSGKTNHSTEKCYFGANAAHRPPPRHRRPERQNQVQERANQSNSKETFQAAAQKLKLKTPTLHSGAAIDRPETTKLLLPPMPEVVWQQPQETHLLNIHKTSTTGTHENTHMPESKQRNDEKSQMLPMKETSSQVSGSSKELFLGNQTGSTLVQSLNDSKKPQSEIQRHELNKIANDKGDDNISPPKVTNSQIEEQLRRDDITNELYMPLSSTIVLKRKKEMLYVPLVFRKSLTIDALVDSRGYVSAIAQNEFDRIKQQAPPITSKTISLPIFESKLQMAS